MNRTIRRALAVILAVFSAASLVVTLFLLIRTWQASSQVQDQLLGVINQTQEAIDTVGNGLISTQQVLTDTENILKGMAEMMLSVTSSVHEVPPVLQDLEDLSGDSLPKMINSTQVSIKAAQESAGRMEDMLVLVSQIPFFPGGKYEPKITLKDALGQVVKDLNSINQPLENMKTGIKSTRENLEGVETQGANISMDLKNVSTNLQSATTNLEATISQIQRFSKQLKILEQKIPIWIVSMTWVLTFLLAWIGLAQIGWLIYAISLI